MFLRVFLIVTLLVITQGFYLPGIAPTTYCTNNGGSICPNKIPVLVNRLDSSKSVLPFDYKRFPFCEASKENDIETHSENLGEVLFGDRIAPGPIQLDFMTNQSCTKLCEKTIENKSKEKIMSRKASLFKRAIQLLYQQHWIVDNLPILFCYKLRHPALNGGQPTEFVHCDKGFPVGCYIGPKREQYGHGYCAHEDFNVPKAFYIYNHFVFHITYHPLPKDSLTANIPDNAKDPGRIIRVEIHPYSKKEVCKNSELPFMFMGDDDKVTIGYSYEVHWTKNSTQTWSSRWDYILQSLQPAEVKWYSIINSLVIVLFMSGMIGMILLRTLHRDISRYNQETLEEAQEEFGWKLVHGDVFRPPGKGMLLSVFLGNGVQIFSMALITLVFACLGFLSPANRGFLMTCAVICYVLMGTPSGYTSARIYKMFGGEKWKSNVLLTAFLVPGLVFGIFFLLNLVLWAKMSSAAVPFGTLVAILALWFCVTVPLTFLGAYFGFKRSPIENPVRTNQIPRQVPDQSFYTRPIPGVLLGSILPFGTIFIQLFFIMNSIWAHQTYYMFGMIFLVFIILIITSSETAILICYFHLCAEDYNWWWRSYFTTGFTAVYFFGFCIHYYCTKMALGGVTSALLYFGYTIIMVFLFFLLTGSIGFFSCFWFIRKIYSVVKVD